MVDPEHVTSRRRRRFHDSKGSFRNGQRRLVFTKRRSDLPKPRTLHPKRAISPEEQPIVCDQRDFRS